MILDKLVMVAEFFCSPVPLRIHEFPVQRVNEEFVVISSVVSREQMISSSMTVTFKMTTSLVLSVGTNEANIVIKVHSHVVLHLRSSWMHCELMVFISMMTNVMTKTGIL